MIFHIHLIRVLINKTIDWRLIKIIEYVMAYLRISNASNLLKTTQLEKGDENVRH